MNIQEQAAWLIDIAIEQLRNQPDLFDQYPKWVDVDCSPYKVSLMIGDDMVDIKLYRTCNLEVISWVQYMKQEKQLGFHYNANLLEKFLVTVLVLDKMNVI